MIKKAGVYTVRCPTCSRQIVMHVLSDGSISAKKCSECNAEFEGVNHGEVRNTFIIVPKAKESKTVVNEKAEVKTKVEEKPKERKLPVKSQKESFKIWKE